MSAIRLLDAVGAERWTLGALGDLGIIGAARTRLRRDGAEAVLAPLGEALAGADLGFANLEFPVGEESWVRPGRSSEFRHDAELIPALRRIGVGVLSLANNHVMDCGERGLTGTLEACAAVGIRTVGAGLTLEQASAPVRLEIAGERVAMVGWSITVEDAAGPRRAGVSPLTAERVREDLARAREGADRVIVTVHWGAMYMDDPPPRVFEMAERIEQGGADVILGHHPHVLQGWRRAGRTLTLFSLGDAAFNPRAGDFEASVAAATRRESAAFVIGIADAPGLACVPLVLDPDGLPAPAGASAAAQVERLRGLADGLAEGADRFARNSAPRLLRYEIESLGEHLRRGRIDRALRLLGSVRPRHLGVLWHALTRANGR